MTNDKQNKKVPRYIYMPIIGQFSCCCAWGLCRQSQSEFRI